MSQSKSIKYGTKIRHVLKVRDKMSQLKIKRLHIKKKTGRKLHFNPIYFDTFFLYNLLK